MGVGGGLFAPERRRAASYLCAASYLERGGRIERAPRNGQDKNKGEKIQRPVSPLRMDQNT